jgi:hypothetical protein
MFSSVVSQRELAMFHKELTMAGKKQRKKIKTEEGGQRQARIRDSKLRELAETSSGSHSIPQKKTATVSKKALGTHRTPDSNLEQTKLCPHCGKPLRISDVEAKPPAKPSDIPTIPTNLGELWKWLYYRLTGRSRKIATWIIVIGILSYGGIKIWPHLDWRIHDIKFRMTVENTLKKETGLSETGRFTVYEGKGGERKNLSPDFLFKASSVDTNSISSDGIILRPGKTLIEVKLKKTKLLWNTYKSGHAYVDLVFFTTRDEPTSPSKTAPKSGIPFNAWTLGTKEAIRPLVLADDAAPWRSQPIKATFAKPQDPTDKSVTKAISLLKQGGYYRRKSFKAPAADEDFDNLRKSFIAYEKSRPKGQSGLEVDEKKLMPWDLDVNVLITVGRDPDDPNNKLMVRLEDAKNKIKNEEIPIMGGLKLELLSIDETLLSITRAIVSRYPVRGKITAVLGDQKKKRYARLDVGSWMGVWEGMEFKVFSPGTNEPNAWLVIQVVHPGEGASGVLEEILDPALVIEGSRIESGVRP